MSYPSYVPSHDEVNRIGVFKYLEIEEREDAMPGPQETPIDSSGNRKRKQGDDKPDDGHDSSSKDRQPSTSDSIKSLQTDCDTAKESMYSSAPSGNGESTVPT
jgi:hypothetical protein